GGAFSIAEDLVRPLTPGVAAGAVAAFAGGDGGAPVGHLSVIAGLGFPGGAQIGLVAFTGGAGVGLRLIKLGLPAPLGLGLCGLIGAVFVLGQIVLGDDFGIQSLGPTQFVGVLLRIGRAPVALALDQHFGDVVARLGLGLSLRLVGAGRRRLGA